MRVEHVILAISILNLILLLVNLYLLRHGHTQARQQLQIVVVQQPSGEGLPGGVAVAHLVVSIGKNGTLHHFNGTGDATTLLRLRELRGHEGGIADLYIVPRTYLHVEEKL